MRMVIILSLSLQKTKNWFFSFIGMTKQEIAIEGRSVINIVLETETK